MTPFERYPVDALFTGSSLGNICSFARLSARTDLLGLWSSTDNQYYLGEWTIRVIAGGTPLDPVDTVFGAAYQMSTLRGGPVTAEQLFFLPYDAEADHEPAMPDQRVARFIITLRNGGSEEVHTVVRHSLTFPAVITDRFTKQPPEDQRDKSVHVHRHGHFCTIVTDVRPHESRVFGSDLAWTSCVSDSSTMNAEYVVHLAAGESRELSFAVVFSPKGMEEALGTFKRLAGARESLSRSTRMVEGVLSQARLFTPDPVINRAMQWAKVNILRVRHRFRTGEAFTNDPPQDIVVLRDLAWFALGVDSLHPQWSRGMLRSALKYGVHDGGKITEYYHADERTPERHDYHLNINDDTPLLVWALVHHCRLTGDRDAAMEYFPVIKRACDWIMRQVVGGLVHCSAQGTNVWGICSWRNIIDDYTLSGAVTEINAECYIALAAGADLARHLGKIPDASRFESAAATLRSAMNETLRSEKTDLYVLNIDTDGVRHHDVTGDLVFPVLAGVADPDLEERILERLTRPDMWTEHGVRTVSLSDPGFDPEAGYQLLGGIWPNLTAWVAYCLRKSRPEKVAEALLNIVRAAESPRPAAFGYVVPGEFPERVHGSGFESRGMTLSPWTPPTYFWLGIEGLLGLTCSWHGIGLHPAMPASWRWIAVKDLPVHGGTLTAFLHEGALYASRPVDSMLPVRVGVELKTTSDSADVMTAGLFIDGECIVFAGAADGAEGVIRCEYNGSTMERAVTLAAGEAVVLRIPTERIAA